jgi:hypothetical protein
LALDRKTLSLQGTDVAIDRPHANLKRLGQFMGRDEFVLSQMSNKFDQPISATHGVLLVKSVLPD